MKTIYRISLFFNLCCACFILIKGTEFYYKNYVSMPPVKEEFRQEQTIEKTSDESEAKDALSEETKADEEIKVSNTLDNCTTCDTIYIVKEHDYRTGETTSHQEKLPEQYIGKTREEIEGLFVDYNMAPALSDLELGFEEISLDSFSKKMVIATKYYSSKPENEDFYLMVEDDYISVYCGDLKTVYLYTDIYMNDLPENLQQEILDKKHINDKEELYNFLESYSS